MVKVKTKKLEGPALDYAVAYCQGYRNFDWDNGETPNFSSRYGDFSYFLPLLNFQVSDDWELAGPIIDYNCIMILPVENYWVASCGAQQKAQEVFDSYGEPFEDMFYTIDESDCITGKTPLVAAMRCYVASKLGDEVEIPNELMEQKK